MNHTTKSTIEIAKTLARRGFTVANVEVHTPDRRTWSIATVPAGRGRHANGYWGTMAGALGGFRLFEIDADDRLGPIEHDAPDADTWTASEIADYLDAVGQPKAPPSGPRTTDPTT